MQNGLHLAWPKAAVGVCSMIENDAAILQSNQNDQIAVPGRPAA